MIVEYHSAEEGMATTSKGRRTHEPSTPPELQSIHPLLNTDSKPGKDTRYGTVFDQISFSFGQGLLVVFITLFFQCQRRDSTDIEQSLDDDSTWAITAVLGILSTFVFAEEALHLCGWWNEKTVVSVVREHDE